MAISDPQIEALRRIYLAAGMRVRQGLLTATVEGWEWRRCRILLERIEDELGRLNVAVGDWETGQLELAYETGAGQAEERLAGLGSDRSVGSGESDVPRAFSTLPKEPLKALAAEVAGRRSEFVGAILRQSRDYLRELATGELARGLGIGDSPYAVGRAIRDGSIQRLLLSGRTQGSPLQALAEGIDRACGVIYSDGSVHSLHAYGEMSARTGTLAALNEGSIQRYQQADVHLVKVSEHGTLCFLCQPLEGCVFALDAAGEAAGYPRPRFTLPRHPNCRHSWGPYLESAFGPGKKIDTAVAAMDDRDLYARMRDDVPRGKELMEAARRGFRNRAEYDRLKAQGQEYGPRYRRAGIEARRIEATRRVLESGGRLSYPGAMGQVTGEAAKAEGRGIFAGGGNHPRLVGSAQGRFGEILQERAGTREIRVVPSVVGHYKEHAGQFDIERAEALLPSVIADPDIVVQGNKATTAVAVSGFDADHYMVVPVKSLPGENWIETVYIEERRRLQRRGWVRKGILYQKGE